MLCSECQNQNPKDSKFCLECGQKLEQKCPQCKKSLPLEAKFCNGCGHKLSARQIPPLKELSLDEKLAKIQKYLPKGITEKILSHRDRIEGERKQVTVMFCDMEGFTAFVDKLGPEKAYSIMDQIYEILIHKVHDYEGTVNELTGDGIMALFGAPIALEDAPLRAISSSLSIHRALAKFNDINRQENNNIPPVTLRIGIHTGSVVVGVLGNDLRVEFKAVGDTVNLASRIEGLAEPGTTYVSADTFKLTEGFFRFEAIGEKAIKGKESPVTIYRVIEKSTSRTRFDVSAELGLTPFVGREREKEILLDSFERVKKGEGQAISIVSEAGNGKSRLLYEFRKAVASEDAIFLEGKCLSYSKNRAYQPVVDFLKSFFNIEFRSSDTEIKKKVKKGLDLLKVEVKSTLPYILELLSVKDSGIDKQSMSSEAKRDHTLRSLKRILIKGSEMRPVILAIEDLHWIDNSSKEALNQLLDSIAGARVLLVLTYRPDFIPSWGVRSYISQINLSRLTNRESSDMAAHILDTEKISPDLIDLLAKKSEGIPFFIEEYIKYFRASKIIEKRDDEYHLSEKMTDMTVPSTIQDVIMSKIDRLSELSKKVLETGAIIEREFGYELLNRVTGLTEQELLISLNALKDVELIYERGIFPETTYIFRHALTREVTLQSILEKRKRELHNQIGEAIERLYEENLEEYYYVLVEHFLQSENYEKAAEYANLASRKARHDTGLFDAITFAKKCIFCLEKMPLSDELNKKIIDARTHLGLYYNMLNHHEEAQLAVDPVVDAAKAINYKRRLTQIYCILGAHASHVEEDFPRAFDLLERSIKLSEETGDFVTFAHANLWLGLAAAYNCEFEKAYTYSKKPLDLAIANNDLWATPVIKSNISTFAFIIGGKVDLGYQISKEAVLQADECDDIFAKGVAYASCGVACHYKGLINNALENLIQGTEYSQRAGMFSWAAVAQHFLAEIYFILNDYQKAKEYYDRNVKLSHQNVNLPSWNYLNQIGSLRAEVMTNKKKIDYNRLLGLQRQIKVAFLKGWAASYISEIYLNPSKNNFSESEKWIRVAIESNRRNGMRWHLADDYALFAELLIRKGESEAAREKLTKAIELFKECGSTEWIERYDKKLAEI